MIKIELGFVSDDATSIIFPSDSSDITTQHQVHLIQAALLDTFSSIYLWANTFFLLIGVWMS